jgi:hypothetical protein
MRVECIQLRVDGRGSIIVVYLQEKYTVETNSRMVTRLDNIFPLITTDSYACYTSTRIYGSVAGK